MAQPEHTSREHIQAPHTADTSQRSADIQTAQESEATTEGTEPPASAQQNKKPTKHKPAQKASGLKVQEMPSAPSVRTDSSTIAASRRKPFAALAIIVILVLAVGFIVDTLQHAGQAYPGVSVGGIDVSGLTSEEIIEKVSATYEPVLHAKPVRAYASQEALDGQLENAEIDDFTTVEEAYNQTVVWTRDAESLDARINYESAAEQAVHLGRSSPLERMGLLVEGQDIALSVDCNNALVEALATDIDNSLGYSYQDCDVSMSGTEPYVIEGHDGDMINREWLEETICSLLMRSKDESRDFVAETEYHPLEINYEQAQECANTIADAITNGIDINYAGNTWHADAAKVARWVETEIVENEDGTSYLRPVISPSLARNSILVNTMPGLQSGEEKVRIDENHQDIFVSIDSKGKMPDVDAAIDAISTALFGADGKGSSTPQGTTPSIEMDFIDVPDEMTFDEAIEKGIIAPISQFTTEYTYGALERNNNIHLAADLLNKSIVKANGGTWSFNEIAGDCSEEKGFQAASAISGDETVDEIGGGICQVATTVFNAAYLAGFTINERYNHSLYIPTYPDGRDSAISYPELDLKWSNDSHSDCILVMSYDDTSVTATIYGIDPGYTVETETGEWQEGAKFTTVYKYDPNVASGDEYVETEGSNGMSIQVFRKVTDSNGNVIHEDQFYSQYNAQNKVVVRGGDSGNYQEASSGTV